MSFWNLLKEKAMRSTAGGELTSIRAAMPDPVRISDDPVTLMTFNRGVVAAANTKVSESVAALPYRLYAVVPGTRAKGLVTPHRTLTKSQSDILRGSSPGIDARMTAKKDVIEIHEHPFLDMLQRPCRGWSQYDLIHSISSYLGIIGNAYVSLLKKGDAVTGFQPLESERVEARSRDRETGEITGYRIRGQGVYADRNLDPGDVLHFRRRGAGSVFAGRGNLQECLESVAALYSSYGYVNALLQNMAIPGTLISLKNAQVPPGEDPQTFMNMLGERMHRMFSRSKAGKPMVTFTDTEVKRLDVNMADTKIEAFLESAKKEVAAVFGIPVSLLDDSDSNRATSYASAKNFFKYGVYPKAANICDTFTSHINDHYGPEFYLWWDAQEALETDPKEQADILKIYIDSGVVTTDEARAKLGMSTEKA